MRKIKNFLVRHYFIDQILGILKCPYYHLHLPSPQLAESQLTESQLAESQLTEFTTHRIHGTPT